MDPRMNWTPDPGWHNVQFILVYRDKLDTATLVGQVPDEGNSPLCDPRIQIIIMDGFRMTVEGSDDGSGSE